MKLAQTESQFSIPQMIAPRVFGTVPTQFQMPVWKSGSQCPHCGFSHWDVRRATAECRSCGEVLPL